VEKHAAQIKSYMEDVVRLDTPLIAEAGWGKSWAEAH
jgi:DNA polymerase I-like protein with 3'-5' exonuclease and polymerase domains